MDWNDFQGVNRAYVAELYERYRREPHSIDSATRAFLEGLPDPDALEGREESQGSEGRTPQGALLLGTFNLCQCIRRYGHLAARIDPLGSEPIGDPLLET